MKTAFFSITILLFISCNSKSVEKIQREDISITESEKILIDSSVVEIMKDSIIEEISTKEGDEEEVLETILEFKQTSCFGKCPTFSVELLSDGRMFYNGKANVEKIGVYETTVNNSFIYTVFQEAEKIDYFNLSEKYPTDGKDIPDLPKTIIFLKNEKKERRITDSFDAPLSLQNFEKYLLEKIDDLHWTKVGPQD